MVLELAMFEGAWEYMVYLCVGEVVCFDDVGRDSKVSHPVRKNLNSDSFDNSSIRLPTTPSITINMFRRRTCQDVSLPAC